jgi:hypothetical protein
MNILYSLQHLGYTIPPQADSAWLGEAGPGPSYLDTAAGPVSSCVCSPGFHQRGAQQRGGDVVRVDHCDGPAAGRRDESAVGAHPRSGAA